MQRVGLALALAICGMLPGCAYFQNLDAADRTGQGITFVLPGIEGKSLYNSNIAQGLADGGVDTAIEVYDWTTGWRPLALYHLRGIERNRNEARKLAARIVEYQNQHPGQPVNLVGHSGGGGMSLLTLEELPADRKVTSVVLLAVAMSPDYDLRPVLPKSERGIWNYHSLGDGLYLMAGTTAAGTIDGKHTPSAGAVGFKVPEQLTDAERALYAAKLHQVPYNPAMLLTGNYSGHLGPTMPSFVARHIAPLLATPGEEPVPPTLRTASSRAALPIDR